LTPTFANVIASAEAISLSGIVRPSALPGKARPKSAKPAEAPGYAATSHTTAAPTYAAAAKENAQAAAATAATAASAATATTSNMKSATTTKSSATTTTSATAMASAAAATARQLHEAAGVVFPVEEVERRKTHIGHFLIAKNEALIVGRGV